MASRPHFSRDLAARPGRTGRVLLVDDSIVVRVSIARILDEVGCFSVVDQAASAADALEKLKYLSCDIIILDIEMPGMSGLDAIPLLLEASGDAAILVLSSHCAAGAEASISAMTRGATDTLLKPEARNFERNFADSLIGALARMAETVEAGATAVAPASIKHRSTRKNLARPVRCLGIAASTGGVHATIEFLRAVPNALDMPILVTQHLPPNFIEPFARQMKSASGREFVPARDGHKLVAGEVVVAPGDAHLAVIGDGEDARIRLRRFKAASGCMPSADPMFDSLAVLFGRDAVGIVLSGMGRDGCQGAQALAERGGELLVQDRRSAVVWGMPGAVADRGIAHLVGRPSALGRYVADRAETFGWR